MCSAPGIIRFSCLGVLGLRIEFSVVALTRFSVLACVLLVDLGTRYVFFVDFAGKTLRNSAIYFVWMPSKMCVVVLVWLPGPALAPARFVMRRRRQRQPRTSTPAFGVGCRPPSVRCQAPSAGRIALRSPGRLDVGRTRKKRLHSHLNAATTPLLVLLQMVSACNSLGSTLIRLVEKAVLLSA